MWKKVLISAFLINISFCFSIDEVTGIEGLDHQERYECPICLEGDSQYDSWLQPACGHAFHTSCLVEWRDTTYKNCTYKKVYRLFCPMCRQVISNVYLPLDTREKTACRLFKKFIALFRRKKPYERV